MISRRAFLETGAVVLAGRRLLGGRSGSREPGQRSLPTPTPAQQVWQDCEVGLIFHLDMPVLAGDYTPNNATRRVFDPALYNPGKLDTDQWIAAARSAGASYAIFTATHFNGFLQWQSDLYPYGVKQASWRNGQGDVVADFVTSCRAAGIRPGLYFSTHRNSYQTVWDHWVDWGTGRGTARQAAFNRIAERMTEELCSRYGTLVQIWYDAGVKAPRDGGPDVLPIFERYQPDSVFYHSTDRSDHRWIGNEAGHAAYPCWATMPGPEGDVGVSHNSPSWKDYLHGGDPDGAVWSPGMVDVPLRARGAHDWVWRPGHEDTALSVEELTGMYYASVGRNCNLVIGAVVDPDGLVPQPDADRLGEFGREIARRFGRPLAETAGEGERVALDLGGPRRIDHVVIMEDIARGERIREYRVEGQLPDGRWNVLCRGTAVGHKRIEQVPSVEVTGVRLQSSASRATPRIRRLSVYDAS